MKIGVVAYLKGDFVDYEGQPTVNGVTMALRDFDANGGLVINGRKKRVELVIEAIDQSKEEAVAATRKLINRDGVVAIIGPQYSSDGISAGAVAEQAHVPMFCPVATNPEVTRGRSYVFRMSFLDPAQGGAMARMAYTDLAARTAAILYNEADEYSRGIARVFEAEFILQGGAVLQEKYIPGDPDLKEKLGRLKTGEPDVLYLPGFHKDIVRQVALAKELGLRATLLGSDGWDQRLVPGLAEFDDSYYSLHWSPVVQEDKSSEFTRQYQEAFAVQPNGTAVLTYDAMQLLLHAMVQQQKTDAESIRTGLMALPPYPGVAGDIDFIDSGDPQKDVLIMHVKDGANRYVRYVR